MCIYAQPRRGSAGPAAAPLRRRGGSAGPALKAKVTASLHEHDGTMMLW